MLAGSQRANFAKEFAWGVLLIAVLALGKVSPARRMRDLLAGVQGRRGAREPAEQES